MTTAGNAISNEAAQRYARALFDLALESKALAKAEADMAALGEAFGESAELARAVASPVHRAEDKVKALTALAKALKLSPLGTKFIGIVARNGRAGDLPAMTRAFAALAAAHRGSVTADIASADALTAAQLKELTAALKTALGRDVEVRAEVRPELIGGLTVKVGSRMFDSSLRTKLDGVKQAMKEA